MAKTSTMLSFNWVVLPAVLSLFLIVSTVESRLIELSEPVSSSTPTLSEPVSSSTPTLSEPVSSSTPTLSEPVSSSTPTLSEPVSATPTCNKVYGVEIGDTCFDISEKFSLNTGVFEFINPNLDCNRLFAGQWICISGKPT